MNDYEEDMSLIDMQQHYLRKRVAVDLNGVFTSEDFNSNNVEKLGEKFRDLILGDFSEDVSLIYPEGVEWENVPSLKNDIGNCLKPELVA